MLNPLSQVQTETITLWYLVQHSLSAFNRLQQYFGSTAQAVAPENLSRWAELKLHKNHLQRLLEFQTAEGQKAFQLLLQNIQSSCDFVLTPDSPSYPAQLLPHADHPPIIFGQGQAQALLQPQIAIVGSRKPSPHGRQIAYDFAYYLSEKGFHINSGLAHGIDEAAHRGGLQHNRTIAVMGTGLDLTYPAQHAQLRKHISEQYGAVISEFLPGTPPLQQHFPRRNRIVSGLSLGVIVAEASLNSGSIITAKLAAEQGKVVFAIPGHIYSEFHQGCHQLIREGAILVDHPEQIIEDLALPAQWQISQQQDATPETAAVPELIPQHLLALYNSLDWSGQNMDQLAQKLQLNVSALTGLLMELELLGLCIQQAGLYLRCRQVK